MKEWDYLYSSILISLELEESGACEELSALGCKHARHVHKLIVVDALGAVLRQRNVLLQQIPQLFQILLVEHLRCFILEKSGARFLADAEVQRVLVVRFFVEKLRNVFKGRIFLFFLLLFIF